MNCPEARDHFPDLLQGPPAAEPATHAAKHLAECAVCRREYEALERVCRLLNSVPVPRVEVDLAQLYREAARRQEQRMHGWRRATLACGGAAAAVLLLALGLRLEVRVEPHQLVLRWNAPPPVEEPELPAPAPPIVLAAGPGRLDAEQLQLLSELIHALAADVDARDRRQQEELTQLHERLRELQRQTGYRLAVAERELAGLQAVQFILNPKGEKP